MGLIQVPRGLRTRKDYAPADLAFTASESELPWAWQSLRVAAVAQRGHMVNVAPNVRVPRSLLWRNGGSELTRHGWGLSPGHTVGFDTRLGGVDNVTVFAYVRLDSRPSTNENIIGQIQDDNTGWSLLFDNSDFVSGDTDTIAWRPNVNNNDRGSMSAGTDSAVPGWHSIVCVYAADPNAGGSGYVSKVMFVNGVEVDSGRESYTEFATQGLTVPTYIGEDRNGGFTDNPFDGVVLTAGVMNHALWREEARELSRNPFGLFRRRPLLVPVSTTVTGPSTPTNLQATDITQTSARVTWE